MRIFEDTKADTKIKDCIKNTVSFSVIAGAGSGKTTSLLTALDYLRDLEGKSLRKNCQKVACITYTNRAVDVINNRLNQDDLFLVSTLHSFLWGEIKRFQQDIWEAIREEIIPKKIEKKQEEDNGGQSQRAKKARKKIRSLENDLANLENVESFDYKDNNYSNFSDGEIGHDDLIDITAHLIINKDVIQRIIGQKYPYIFIDEAQDTYPNIVEGFNKIVENAGLPIIGYFGDPMQQIYHKRAGDFTGPDNSKNITKEENFRCSTSVINLLNAFRKDVHQIPGAENKEIEGSVGIKLIKSETGQGNRKSYTPEQLEAVTNKYDVALEAWGWNEDESVKKLFLARQMIARRLGFSEINKLFKGDYSSSDSEDNYEKGDHYLLAPFVKLIYPAVLAYNNGDINLVFQLMKQYSPAFSVDGENASLLIGTIIDNIKIHAKQLVDLYNKSKIVDTLQYCSENRLIDVSDRLMNDLNRQPRPEEYNKDLYSMDKGDWLADSFFNFDTSEIGPYCDFTNNETPFSTQHGVKGEQYQKVLVVFDDTEAAWTWYSFAKTLAPEASGQKPTKGQQDKSKKLAYVCFSRAEKDLRIILFTPNTAIAKKELIEASLFDEEQISIG